MFDDTPGLDSLPEPLRTRLELAALRMAGHMDARDLSDTEYLSRAAAGRDATADDASIAANDAVPAMGRAPYRPFEEVGRLLLEDPSLLAHFRGANHKRELEMEIGPEPGDESLRERWLAAHSIAELLKRRFAPVFEMEQRQARSAARARKLALLAEHDPLFERTTDMLAHYRKTLTPSCRRRLDRACAASPHAFMEVYGDMRDEAERMEHVLEYEGNAGAQKARER